MKLPDPKELIRKRRAERKATSAKPKKPRQPRPEVIPDGPYRVWCYIEAGIAGSQRSIELIFSSMQPLGNPTNSYAESKALIEQLVREHGGKA